MNTPWYKKDVGIWLPPRSVDVVAIVQNLAVMLEAGLTLVEALDVVSEQSTGSLQKTIANILERVRSGVQFSVALKNERKVFSPIFLSAVEIGERSGTLSQNLVRVAEQMERETKVRRDIRSALFYPTTVLIATAILGFSLATFVLPQMVTVFGSLNVELPLTTRFLIFIARVFGAYGYIIAPLFVLAVICVFFILKRPAVYRFTNRFVLRFPFFGAFIKDINRARVCRAMSTLLKSGVPVQEAVAIARSSVKNEVYRASLLKMHEYVSNGESIASALGRYPNLYPKMIYRMLAVGEQSGSMQGSFEYLAVFYEQKVGVATKDFSTIIEPVLLIGIGFVVAFVALSILSPIYSITENLGR